MCKTHSLESTALGEVNLLSKQANLLSAAHFYTDLQQTEMVKTNENDTGGAMAAQAHSANSAGKVDFTMTRQRHFMYLTHSTMEQGERENERKGRLINHLCTYK